MLGRKEENSGKSCCPNSNSPALQEIGSWLCGVPEAFGSLTREPYPARALLSTIMQSDSSIAHRGSHFIEFYVLAFYI